MYREIKQEELKVHKGYHYFNDANHPLTNSSYIVYYHRHVASIKIGRWLTTDEHVHHIDENKLNNTPENLQVVSKSEHVNIHRGYLVEKPCKECGKLFIPKKNRIVFCTIECVLKSKTKLDGLTKDELEYLIWTEPFTKLGAIFSCSDNAIRKWAIRLGCTFPPTRFHVKYTKLDSKLEQYNLMLETKDNSLEI